MFGARSCDRWRNWHAEGRTAIVTGSTIGIAQALAAADADVMLNCFGDAGQIEELRQTLEFASMR